MEKGLDMVSSRLTQISPSSPMSPTMNHVSRKRKALESEVTNKRPKTDICKDTTLVSFSDDILLMILSHLDTTSLLSLRETCTLFNRLCEDYTLWRKVNHTSKPATLETMDIIQKLVHSETRSIEIRGRYNGDPTSDDLITVEWLRQIAEKCPNLQVLALPNHHINCSAITLSDFPKTLTTLDLSATHLRMLPTGKSYFRDISAFIPNLAILVLSHCEWFEPHSLMAISKCGQLEELRLNDCSQVKDCLAYCGLSTRGGFKALRTLDLRRCLVTTSELVCFSSVTTLTNIYLENRSTRPVIIDPAITILCTRNELELHGEGVRALVSRPQLLIERLIIRHFPLLTDVTLQKLAQDAKKLRFLDVTGCGVTKSGIESFKELRPSVELVHSLLDDE